MSVKELKCPKCGASVSQDKNVCDYCKAQYTVVEEKRAVLFGDSGECNTFIRLEQLKKDVELKRIREAQYEEIRGLLEACKTCHIKNCHFFNRRVEELFPLTKNEKDKMLEQEFDRVFGGLE